MAEDDSYKNSCLFFAKQIGSHPAFKELCKESTNGDRCVLKNKKLLAAHDSEIFIWNEQSHVVHVVNTKDIFYNSCNRHHFQVKTILYLAQFCNWVIVDVILNAFLNLKYYDPIVRYLDVQRK